MKYSKFIAPICILTFCFFSVITENANANANEGFKKFNKCKDENGKWHYGSANLSKCAKSSDITVMNDRGVVLDRVDREKTEAEISAALKKQEQELLALEEQKRIDMEKERVTTIYQSLEDIEDARIRALNSIQVKITQHQNYVEALRNQERILNDRKATTTNVGLKNGIDLKIEELRPKKEYSKNRILELEQEKIKINEYYDQDLAVFEQFSS